MLLWTLQPVEVYEEIQEKGMYVTDEKYIDSMFKSAYDWLVPKMETRIGKKPRGVQYPVWAWHTWEDARKKPDLRQRHMEKGMKAVCLTLEIPDNQVVLTDFDNWHFVLNDSYISKTEEDYSLYEKLSLEEQEQAKIQSWNRVFDIERFESDWYIQGSTIQATFWQLKQEYIKKVQHFISR